MRIPCAYICIKNIVPRACTINRHGTRGVILPNNFPDTTYIYNVY